LHGDLCEASVYAKQHLSLPALLGPDGPAGPLPFPPGLSQVSPAL